MDKEKNEVSLHELRVYLTLKNAPSWLSAKEIGERSKIYDRTARAHAAKLVALGLCDVAEVFPGHRYRLSKKADKRNVAYLQRLERAVDVFDDLLMSDLGRGVPDVGWRG